jgi:hypothetical protein
MREHRRESFRKVSRNFPPVKISGNFPSLLMTPRTHWRTVTASSMLVPSWTKIIILVQYYTNIGQLFFATIGHLLHIEARKLICTEFLQLTAKFY